MSPVGYMNIEFCLFVFAISYYLNCFVFSQTTCTRNRVGLDYIGTQKVSSSSLACVPWSSITSLYTKDSLFPEKSAAAAGDNCRNPGFSKPRPWCYVSTSGATASCDISICEQNCRLTEHGNEYNGHIATDASGNTCVAWANFYESNSTDINLFRYDKDLAAVNNFCRNIRYPLSTSPFNAQPWCFIDTNGTKSDCSISFCSNIAGQCRSDHLGLNYRGNISLSALGSTCVAWSTVYSTVSWPTSEALLSASNFCRNPTNSPVGLWCFVSSGTQTLWQPCSVPVCEPKTTCPSSTSDFYRYMPTISVHTCSNWSSVYNSYSSSWYSFVNGTAPSIAASPLFHPAHLPDSTLTGAASYCRNPDNDPLGPWCPASNGSAKIYCRNPCERSTCLKDSRGLDYYGTVQSTRRNVFCQHWIGKVPWEHNFDVVGDFPDTSVFDAENFCRNPNNNPWGPWCIKSANISDEDYWDYCSVGFCTGVTTAAPTSAAVTKNCKTTTAGIDYAGPVHFTETGKLCQPWASQTPHPHPYYLPQMFNAATLSEASNKCRNPNADPKGPWCFVNQATPRFEYCFIPVCLPVTPVSEFSIFLLAFGGLLNLTSSLALIPFIIKTIALTCSKTTPSQPSIGKKIKTKITKTRTRTKVEKSISPDIVRSTKKTQAKFSHNHGVIKELTNKPDVSSHDDTDNVVQTSSIDLTNVPPFDYDPVNHVQLAPIEEEEARKSLERSRLFIAKLERETQEQAMDFDVESLAFSEFDPSNSLRRYSLNKAPATDDSDSDVIHTSVIPGSGSNLSVVEDTMKY